MDKTSKQIRTISGIAILSALVIALTFVSNYVNFGVVNINLALIVIVLGACIYGPVAGLALGLINGAITCIAPSTLAAFMPVNAWATILLCLLKTGLAGLVSGLIFLPFKKKEKLQLPGTIISALVVPVINTGIFICGVLLFFMSVYGNDVTALMTGVLTVNFLIEVITIAVLSPSIYFLIKYAFNRFDAHKSKQVKEQANKEVEKPLETAVHKCEHCGCLIDDNEPKCPNCGADNKNYTGK